MKVTTLSYVMSLMPPSIQRDLRLERFGYKIHPQGMGYLPIPGGGSIIQSDDPDRTLASVARFSRKDADAYFAFEEWIGRVADILGPLLMRTPPHLGSHRFRDIKDVAGLGWRLRKKGLEVEADKTFLEALRLDPQNPAAKIGLRVPAGRRTGATDVLLRFSDSIASIRFRRPLALVQGVWFLATLFWVLNHPYVGLWLPELLTACFVAWMMYYAFAPQVVKSIAKRRGVCVH